MPANLINVPSLRSELLGSTALTPTHHKGGLGIVIGIVATIATAGLGGPLAAAIGVSQAVGTAIAGAAFGAIAAGITGGDPLLGAVAGGFGGFISGGGLGDIFGPATGGVGTAGAFDIPGDPFGSTGFEAFTPSGALTSPLAAPATISLQPTISGGGGVSQAATFEPGGGSFITPDEFGLTGFETDVSGGGFTGGPQIDPFVNTFDPGPGVVGQQRFGVEPGVQQGGLLVEPQAASGGGTAPPPAAEKAFEFSDLLPTAKEFRTQAISGFGKLAINALTGALEEEPPQTRREQEATVLADRALEGQLRLQNKQEAISNRFLTQAAGIRPDQQGQLQFALERERFGRLAREQERRLAPNQTGTLAAFRRRALLDRSRLGGFQRGRESGQAQQERLLAAGSAALPTGSTLTASTQAALADANRGFARQQQENKNRAELFAGLLPNPDVLTAEERRRRAAGIA